MGYLFHFRMNCLGEILTSSSLYNYMTNMEWLIPIIFSWINVQLGLIFNRWLFSRQLLPNCQRDEQSEMNADRCD